jgi:branched-chain amino acid transport system ATP-binding protein
MLEIKNLRVSYRKKIRALKGVSLSVCAGEIVCLIGANGAGKSTLLNAVSGLIPSEDGEILFDGEKVNGRAPHRLAAQGLLQVPEGRRIFSRLTVLENLEMGAFLRKDAPGIKSDMERVFALFPVLRDRRGQSGGTLSGGEQQMLALGRALMGRPRVLMLDEPSMGLAPLMVETIFRTIRKLNEEGITILLVEQNARQALAVANRGYVMETGLIALAGASADLAQNPDVKKAYLGLS